MRKDKIKQILARKGLDIAFFLSPQELSYLIGFSGAGILAIGKKDILVLSPMEQNFPNKLDVRKIISKERLSVGLKKALSGCSIKKAGVCKDSFSLKQYAVLKKVFPSLRFVDISKDLSDQRMIKDPDEIRRIKESCKMASDIMQRCIDNFHFFRTEYDARAFLISETLKRGAKESFEPIVASGPDASQPHYAQNKELARGFCVLDFGIVYKGYCSDISRTIYLGRPNSENKELYNILLHLQEEMILNVKAGVVCGDLDFLARKKLKGLSKYFIHSLGHGVGMLVHERPTLSKQSKDVLCEGMVVTIEPGIYFKNKLGIRIEDCVLVENGAPKILTHTKKELIIINK